MVLYLLHYAYCIFNCIEFCIVLWSFCIVFYILYCIVQYLLYCTYCNAFCVAMYFAVCFMCGMACTVQPVVYGLHWTFVCVVWYCSIADYLVQEYTQQVLHSIADPLG